MRFVDAVRATRELSERYRLGVQALTEADRNHLEYEDSRRLTGSVNLEEALRPSLPHDPIWDYGIGWRTSEASECAVWVEVHPASSSHVGCVIGKVDWLKKWLRTSAPELKSITRREYVWIASGRVALQRGSRQAHQLAMAGVSFPRERFRLS